MMVAVILPVPDDAPCVEQGVPFGVLTAVMAKGMMPPKLEKDSPDEMVRKLQSAGQFAAEGASGEEIDRRLEVSVATLHT